VPNGYPWWKLVCIDWIQQRSSLYLLKVNIIIIPTHVNKPYILIEELPELGDGNRQQIAAPVGTAP
jgi:hypothetical protein